MPLACPHCGKEPLRHSRSRSFVERLRRRLTGRAPFRCRACDWRGWRADPGPTGSGPREIHGNLTEAELERLDPDKRDS